MRGPNPTPHTALLPEGAVRVLNQMPPSPPADHLRRLSRTPRPPASIRTHPTTTHTPRRRAHRAAQSRAQSRLARRARRAAQSRTQSRAEPRAKSRRAAPTAVPAPPRVALALEGVQPRPPLEASRPLRVALRAQRFDSGIHNSIQYSSMNSGLSWYSYL